MHIDRSYFGFACRAAAFGFLMAGTTSLMQAQQSSSLVSTSLVSTGSTLRVPLFVASNTAPADPASYSSSSSSSSSSLDDAAGPRFDLSSSALESSQPPPRRRYGRPNYSDSHSNPDGSEKYTFIAGAGASAAIGDTHRYETEGFALQVGGGRNWNKTFGVMLQFDYDKFGLQGATIANQEYIYNFCTYADVTAGGCSPEGPTAASSATPIDGNNHVWSFTLDPTYTLKTEGSLGAYAVLGGGFYHKVTNFTTPEAEEECYYFCEEVEANANIDHYTSNAFGVNGGFGLTYKFSHFSNERFYVEAKYVLMLNSQRHGVTSANVANSPLSATDFYPANSNRTTFIPVIFGLRF